MLEKTWECNGFRCFVKIVRLHRGSDVSDLYRCGYVAIPREHPYWNIPYGELNVKVHGSLTYGELKSDGLYYLGFDCYHAGDRTSIEPESSGKFWLLDEVIEETNKIANQLSVAWKEQSFNGV